MQAFVCSTVNGSQTDNYNAETMRHSHKAYLSGFTRACAITAGLVVATPAENADLSPREVWKATYHRPNERVPMGTDSESQPKAALGRTLFFEPALSKSGTRSCGSCHNPDLSWADGLKRAQGESPFEMQVRTPTLLNVGWLAILGWDGKFPTLESVAFKAISNPGILDMNEPDVLARLAARPAYVNTFAETFGPEGITRRTVEQALAAFQRTIVSGEAPFDRWIAGDETAIHEPAKRGFDLFNGRARCAGCHSGWSLTDGSFHDVGSAQGDDIGRGRLFPTSTKLQYAFKVPTLRDVADRGPYLHDGSAATLPDVIAIYDKGGIDRPSRSNLIHPLNLTDTDKSDLIAFLATLTAEKNFPENARP